MTKYSNDFRTDVIQAMESGASERGVARKYVVSERMGYRCWVNYCKSGIKSLIGVSQGCSAKSKMHVIESRKERGLSYPQATAQWEFHKTVHYMRGRKHI